MLKEDKYRLMLEEAVEDLYKNYVTPQAVAERVEKYRQITKPYLMRMPDSENARIKDSALYDELTDGIGDEVMDNYHTFKETMKKPWPFFVDYPQADRDNSELTLSWGAAYDTQTDEVTYEYILARDYLFKDVVEQKAGLTAPFDRIGIPAPGTYYLKVKATNKSGYYSECFDYTEIDDVGNVYGCYSFVVEDDRSITVTEKEE